MQTTGMLLLVARTRRPTAMLAPRDPRRARLARPLDHAATLVGRLVERAPAAASPDQLSRGRLRPAPLHPELTNYR